MDSIHSDPSMHLDAADRPPPQDHDEAVAQQLLQSVAGLQAQLQGLDLQVRNNANRAHHHEQHILNSQAAVQAALSAASASAASPAPRFNEPVFKTPQPDKYNGDRRKTTNFVGQLLTVFESAPTRFATNKAKINFAVGCLQDEALRWFHSFRQLSELDKAKPEYLFLSDWSAFQKKIKQVCGDPNEKEHALEQLHHVVQTTSVSAYAAEFQRLSTLAEITDN